MALTDDSSKGLPLTNSGGEGRDKRGPRIRWKDEEETLAGVVASKYFGALRLGFGWQIGAIVGNLP